MGKLYCVDSCVLRGKAVWGICIVWYWGGGMGLRGNGKDEGEDLFGSIVTVT